MSEFFEGVPQYDVRVAGIPLKLPVFYRDSATVNAVFTAATRRVASLLPDRDLHPVELRPGRCLVSFTGLEHRDSDIGPYSELIVSAVVAFGHRPLPMLDAIAAVARQTFGLYVLHLPVTSEIACTSGVVLYGLPKFEAEVAFRRGAGRLSCEVSEGGHHVLTLTAEDLRLYRSRRVHATLYSPLEGALLGTQVELNQLEYAQTLRGDAATVSFGREHRMAKDLAALDVEPRSVLLQIAPRGELILFPPHPAHVPLARVRTDGRERTAGPVRPPAAGGGEPAHLE